MSSEPDDIDAVIVDIALRRILNRRVSGGPRSQVIRRLGRDVLAQLCRDIIDPRIENSAVFDKLIKDVGPNCPARSSLYRFSDLFLTEYDKVRSESDGANLSPMMAAVPLREVARRLCVGEAAVRQLVDEGKLRTISVGGAVRVPLDALERLLAGMEARQ